MFFSLVERSKHFLARKSLLNSAITRADTGIAAEGPIWSRLDQPLRYPNRRIGQRCTLFRLLYRRPLAVWLAEAPTELGKISSHAGLQIPSTACSAVRVRSWSLWCLPSSRAFGRQSLPVGKFSSLHGLSCLSASDQRARQFQFMRLRRHRPPFEGLWLCNGNVRGYRHM